MVKKNQQFYIMKLESSKILANNLELHNNLYEAKKNLEMVELGDNQVLRTIRRITNHPFDAEKLKDLVERKIKLRCQIKKDPSAEKKKELYDVLGLIDNMLYIPDYVSVVSEKRSQYNKIAKKGFLLNGIHYVRLLCSPGNARKNTAFFVREEIFKTLVKILANSHNKVKMSEAKYNAYFALGGSATFEVSTPGVIVVPDLEIARDEKVDWVDFIGGDYSVSEKEKSIKFNMWDGMGLISPSQAKKWAQELELDYLPSGFLLRAPFIKGMVFTFDFHKFAYDVAGTRMIKDVWGNEHHVDEAEVIITQSQFKLWSAYNNWEHYQSALVENQLGFGVAKLAPEKDKNFVRTNYQFLQVLNMSDEDIAGFCQPTVDWFDGVLGGDESYIKLYLMGKVAEKNNGSEAWASLREPFVKALMIDNTLIKDNYIQSKISQSLQKRIKESYIGKLLIHGNFQIMISDPYALCEHMFGMEVKGLLNRGEYYSEYWDKRGADTVVGMRSPLTWRSEVNKMSLKSNDKMKEWYQYLNSGIVYNVFGVDCLINAGADFDGDLLCTTDNPYFIKCCYGGLPVLGEHGLPKKNEIKLRNLYKYDSKAFNTKIGFITNCSTSLYEMLTKYKPEDREYGVIIDRLKLCCHFQALTIDSAKGIKTQPFPKWWTKWQKVKDDMSPEEKATTMFNNSLVIEKRPEFMRYLYSTYNNQYKQFRDDYDRLCEFKFGKSMGDLDEKDKSTEDYRIISEKYTKFNPLLETKGVMNKIYHFMEDKCKKIKTRIKEDKNFDFYKIYSSSQNLDEEKLSMMINYYNSYLNFKKNSFLQEEYGNLSKYCQYLKQEMEWLSFDTDELIDLALYICYCKYKNKPRDFVWDLFGDELLLRISAKKGNHKKAFIPVVNKDGDIKYLGEKYKMEEVDLSDYI